MRIGSLLWSVSRKRYDAAMKIVLGNHRGVTLIELLIVVAMLGLVMTSILGLYQTTQNSASTQDEVVEVQQNLRIGLDQMTRDIRNAGFMIDKSTFSPLETATATTLTLHTAAVPARMARIVAHPTTTTYSTPGDLATELTIYVALEDMVDFFKSGDRVRIIRPPNQSEPLDDTFQVTGKNRSARTITLNDFSTANIGYQAGDVIVRVPNSTATLPRTIAYSLSGNDLMRNDGITTRVVANKVSSLDFEYLENGDWVTAPGSTGDISAVRIILEGETANIKNGIKTRELRGVVTLRN